MMTPQDKRIRERARELAERIQRIYNKNAMSVHDLTGDVDSILEQSLHAIAAETVEECAKFVEENHVVPGINPPKWLIEKGTSKHNLTLAKAIRQLAKGDGHG